MEDIYKYDLKSVHFKGCYIAEFYDREPLVLDVDDFTIKEILSHTDLKYCEVDEYWKKVVTTNDQYEKELSVISGEYTFFNPNLIVK